MQETKKSININTLSAPAIYLQRYNNI